MNKPITKKTEGEWEREFDRHFSEIVEVPDVERVSPANGKYVTIADLKGLKEENQIIEGQSAEELKDFIHSLLSQQKREWVGKIEEWVESLEKSHEPRGGKKEDCEVCYWINDLKSLIQEEDV